MVNLSRILLGFIFSFAVFIVLLSIIDGVLEKKSMALYTPGSELTPELYISKEGWSIVPNLFVNGSLNFGNKTTVFNQYYDYGFRRWGNTSSNKTKVLILGDSFTQDIGISNGFEYYSYLEKEFNSTAEFFVSGVGGYGTLQEFLVLNETIGIIKPDVIIWQFCDNDLVDNMYFASVLYYPLSDMKFRPFYENNKIIYRWPRPFSGLRSYPQVFNFFIKPFDRLIWHLVIQIFTMPRLINTFSAFFNENTKQVFLLATARTGNTPIFLFSVDKMRGSLLEICYETGINCIPGAREIIDANNASELFLPDGHFNVEGNRILGEYLAEYFKKAGVFNISK